MMPFIVLLLWIFYSADGNSDAFFLRVKNGKKKNLILGTSRAAQGINPEELEGQSFYNFAFTASISPYGEVYRKAIMGKLDTSDHDQKFLVTVDPWSLSSDTLDLSQVKERNGLLNKVSLDRWFTPIQYFLLVFDRPFIEILDSHGVEYLHPNGWLEINVPMDSTSILDRTCKKLEAYGKVRSKKLSEARLNEFVALLNTLERFGDICLIRLPVSNEMRNLEDDLFPNFEEVLFNSTYFEGTARSQLYLDLQYLAPELDFTDGNHIARNSTHRVASEIEKTLEIL
jgi:hypothetical protein